MWFDIYVRADRYGYDHMVKLIRTAAKHMVRLTSTVKTRCERPCRQVGDFMARQSLCCLLHLAGLFSSKFGQKSGLANFHAF